MEQRADGLLRLIPIRLKDRKTERGCPLDRGVDFRHDRCAMREPSHDFASVLKHVVQSVQSSFRGVCRDSVPDAFAFETDAFFQAR